MVVGDLMAELEQLDPELEVRLAMQPSWPFEHSIAQLVVSGSDKTGRWPGEVVPEGETQEVVFLVEGGQIGYLQGEARAAVGW